MALKSYPIDYIYDRSIWGGWNGTAGLRVGTQISVDRRDTAGVSVGQTDVSGKPIVKQGTSIFTSIAAAIASRQINVLTTNPRRIEVSNTRRIPVIAGPIRPPSPPVIRSPGATAPGLPTPSTTRTNDMALDLGGILGNLGGAYINARYGGQPAGYAAPQLQPIGPTTAAILGTTPALGVPFVDVIPEASTDNMVWNPRANCGQGKWIKRQKRRRRRLATASDIKDLAALNGVTTPQQKVTWIATHPS